MQAVLKGPAVKVEKSPGPVMPTPRKRVQTPASPLKVKICDHVPKEKPKSAFLRKTEILRRKTPEKVKIV